MHKSFAEFVAMGGYAGFVWASYGAWLLVIALNIWSARSAHAEARRQAQRRLAMRDSAQTTDEEQ